MQRNNARVSTESAMIITKRILPNRLILARLSPFFVKEIFFSILKPRVQYDSANNHCETETVAVDTDELSEMPITDHV